MHSKAVLLLESSDIQPAATLNTREKSELSSDVGCSESPFFGMCGISAWPICSSMDQFFFDWKRVPAQN
jgi:hypothetical protein